MTKGIAMVTGASSGIGLTYAEKLSSQGYDLILVARRQERLEELAKKIKKDTQVKIEILVADISSTQGMESVAERIQKEDNLTMLVNNAGLGDIALFKDVKWVDAQQMINVNLVALTRLTHAALPGMLDKNHGTIINVASGAAFSARSNGFAVYSASKAYVVHFTEVLQEEIKDTNIRLQALLAGLTRTNLGGAEKDGFFDQFPKEMVMSTEDLVSASMKGLELGEVVCLPRVENYQDWVDFSSAARKIGQGMPSGIPAKRYVMDE